MLSERPAALTLATASSSCCLLTVTPVQVHPVFYMAQANLQNHVRNIGFLLAHSCAGMRACRHSSAYPADGMDSKKYSDAVSSVPLCWVLSASRLCLYLNSMDGHGSPTAANLQNMVSALDVCPLYQSIQLVQLCLLQGVACRAGRLLSKLSAHKARGLEKVHV